MIPAKRGVGSPAISTACKARQIPAKRGPQLTSRSALFRGGAVPVAYLLPLLLQPLLSLDERLPRPPPPCRSLRSPAAPLFYRQPLTATALDRRGPASFFCISPFYISPALALHLALHLLPRWPHVKPGQGRTLGLELPSHFWQWGMGFLAMGDGIDSN